MTNKKYLSLIITALLLVSGTTKILAQTTEFTYQGRLTDTGMVANANYDFQFSLFDAPSAGTQMGSTLNMGGIPVSGGVFTVRLDFGPRFTGSARYLEIAVRQTGSGASFVTLSPRQAITSTPYAVRSLNATNADTSVDSQQLGGIPANQYVQTGDTRLSDDRNPLPGSGNYIQNTNGQQTGASFNVSGNGTVGGILSGSAIVSGTSFNINTNRVLSIDGTSNIFVGPGAGLVNNGGTQNAFFGTEAGRLNTTGNGGSFFGFQAGFHNTTVCCNSFFGAGTGQNTDTGGGNAFFGYAAGNTNTAGGGNSFYGDSTGFSNTTGNNNSFYGRGAGFANTTGDTNSFFGDFAGAANTTACCNSFFGSQAGRNNTVGTFNAFFGGGTGLANTTGNNDSFFGALAGNNNTIGGNNSFFGTQSGFLNTTGAGNSFFGTSAGHENTTGNLNSFYGAGAGISNTTGNGNSFFGNLAGQLTTTGCCNAFFGSQAGKGNTVGTFNAFFGTDIGMNNTTGQSNTFVGNFAGNNNTTGNNNTFVGAGAGNFDPAAQLDFATAIGSFATVSTSNTIALGRSNGLDTVLIPGLVRVSTLGLGGSTGLCLNASNQISSCSSSLRYKTNIAPFNFGLSLVSRLRPITFDWKANGMHDLGFGAEDVAKVNELLIIRNDKGEVEGVKYDRISAILVNAVNEQQTQIAAQQKIINEQQALLAEQQRQLASLQKFVYRKQTKTRNTKKAK